MIVIDYFSFLKPMWRGDAEVVLVGAGAMSLLIGAAANRSIAENRSFSIAELTALPN